MPFGFRGSAGSVRSSGRSGRLPSPSSRGSPRCRCGLGEGSGRGRARLPARGGGRPRSRLYNAGAPSPSRAAELRLPQQPESGSAPSPPARRRSRIREGREIHQARGRSGRRAVSIPPLRPGRRRRRASSGAGAGRGRAAGGARGAGGSQRPGSAAGGWRVSAAGEAAAAVGVSVARSAGSPGMGLQELAVWLLAAAGLVRGEWAPAPRAAPGAAAGRVGRGSPGRPRHGGSPAPAGPFCPRPASGARPSSRAALSEGWPALGAAGKGRGRRTVGMGNRTLSRDLNGACPRAGAAAFCGAS